MSIISKLKVFKQTDPQNPNIYDIGANAENIAYTKDDINDVKSALNDLYSKVGNGGLSETIIAFFKNMNLEEKQLMPINGLSSFEKNDICRLSGRLNVIYDDDQSDPPTPHATITINDRFEWSQSGVTREYISGQNDIVYSLILTSNGLSIDASNFSGHVQIHGLADDEQDNFKIYRSPADKVTKEDLQNQINALKAQIGFRGTIPSTGTGQQIQYLTNKDESYRNICYTDVKFTADSTTVKHIYAKGLIIITNSESGAFEITNNASQLLRGDGVLFNRSDYVSGSWYNLQQSNLEADAFPIKANTNLKVKILLKSGIAVYGKQGNNNPTWYILTGDSLQLISDTHNVGALTTTGQKHTFTFSYTPLGITNITRIGKPLFTQTTGNNPTINFKPNNRNLIPYQEEEVLKTTSFIDLIYPIGSIYMSMNGTPPNYLFGGVWQKIEGRFLLAQGKYHSNQFFPYSVEDKGGMEHSVLLKHNHKTSATTTNFTVTSSKNKIPNGSLETSKSFGTSSKTGTETAYTSETKKVKSSTVKVTDTSKGHAHTSTITGTNIIKTFSIDIVTQDEVKGKVGGVLSEPGLGNNVGNLPPYLVVYMWTRVA